MARRELPIGEFLERATEWIRSVEETKEPIAITRDGVPVAELRPLRADANAAEQRRVDHVRSID